ncbi:MAG: hypothetical protein KDD64_07250 [Bdellovibrionales bacterium]|nr:hypothetical protein [Bdellovibrionales bacterium]
MNRRTAKTVFLLFVVCFVPLSHASAIAKNGRKFLRLKFLSDCDASINNLRSAPEQVSSISTGTSCTASIRLYKKNGKGRKIRLRGKSVTVYNTVERLGDAQVVATGTTNNRGRADLNFDWDDDSCSYFGSYRYDQSGALSEYLERLEDDLPSACVRDFF